MNTQGQVEIRQQGQLRYSRRYTGILPNLGWPFVMVDGRIAFAVHVSMSISVTKRRMLLAAVLAA